MSLDVIAVGYIGLGGLLAICFARRTTAKCSVTRFSAHSPNVNRIPTGAKS